MEEESRNSWEAREGLMRWTLHQGWEVCVVVWKGRTRTPQAGVCGVAGVGGTVGGSRRLRF